jgi:toxin YoeB
MKIFWTKKAAKDLQYWKKCSSSDVERIKRLIESIEIDPFCGIGKPEPLKYSLEGCWSRRISGEHRLVYKVNKGYIEILQCKYHYK